MDETASGLMVVRDYRHRAGEVPRDDIPNGNLPLGSVGPDVAAGYGDTHVMYPAGSPPLQAQAWQGWPTLWETPWMDPWGSLQRRVSTFWTCVDLNTRQLASFPVFGMKGLEVKALPEWSNNPEPGTYADWTEAAKQVFNSLQVAGEVFIWAVGRYKDGPGGADGSVARWVVLHPEWVNVERVEGELEYSLGGKPLNRQDVCHIKYQSMPSNLRGIGPLQWLGQSMMGAAYLEQYSADLARNGGIPWGVLKSKMKLNKAEATDLKNAWVEGAQSRSGAPAVLSGDLELDTLTLSPKDMALLELRVFDETRIAAGMGVPPFLVGLPQPDGLTYANATGLFDYHWRGTLRPMAGTVASAISNWALPGKTRMEFNRDPYVQASPMERATTYQTLFNLVDEKGNRAITVDEIRMAERFLPNQPTTALELQQEGTH